MTRSGKIIYPKSKLKAVRAGNNPYLVMAVLVTAIFFDWEIRCPEQVRA